MIIANISLRNTFSYLSFDKSITLQKQGELGKIFHFIKEIFAKRYS